MEVLRVVKVRLRALFANKAVEADMDDELRLHLQLLIEEYERSGMARPDAERAARLRFGNEASVKERGRDVRGPGLTGDLLRDLRHGARRLRKSPGFTFVAVLSLALGIGANTAIFTVVNAALLRPLPFYDLPRLVSVFGADEQNPHMVLGTSRDNYVDIRDRNSVFEQLAASASITVNLSNGTGGPARVYAELVSGNYFTTLGTRPAIGRGFLPEEDQTAGAQLVTVVGYDIWQTRFGGDHSIVGHTILLNNQPFTVVGVMQAGFHGTRALYGTALWVPYMTYPVTTSGPYRDGLSSRRFTAFEMIGRLKPGVTKEQADSNLKAIAQQLGSAFPNENGGRTLVLRTVGALDPRISQNVAISVGMLMTIATVLLLVACINVANLLLARMTVRQREIAIRQSIGATRVRLIRQFVAEGLLLTSISAAAGLIISKIALGVFWNYRPAFLDANALDLRLDTRVLGFTVAVSLITCMLFALAPALRVSRAGTELKTQGIGGDGEVLRVRHVMITMQVALSLIVLVGAGLFLRSLQRAGQIDPGFAVDQIAMMSIDLGAQGYAEGQGRAFQREVLDQVSAVSGVDGVVLADLVPVWGGGNTRSVYLEGEDPKDPRNGYIIPAGIVSPRYFQVLGIPMVEGRDFDDTDREGTKAVAIVNEAMVRKFWPGQKPIGKRVRFIRTDFFEIIGVVKDSTYNSIGAPTVPMLYRPLSQAYQANVSIVVRARHPNDVLANVRSQIQEMDPRLPITNVMSLPDALGQSLWAARLAARLLTVLGFISLMLAVIGIYGVMAYSVQQRTREIGLRLALGAGRRSVVNLVLGRSLRLSLIGVSIGILLSLSATHFIASLLYGSPTDVVSFCAAGLIVLSAALGASYLPARRATRIDPVIALRAE